MPLKERQVLPVSAIILRRTNYGDSDVVVTLLTVGAGKISALAKGARKSKKRYAGGLGISLQGEGELRNIGGEGGLFLLKSFEVIRSREGLGSDLAKAAHSAYVLELCDRLCATEHPEPAVFSWLENFLDVLEKNDACATRLRIFELGLLGRLGLAPLLSACSRCGRTDLGGEAVRFIPQDGAVFCLTCIDRGDLISASTRTTLLALQVASLNSNILLERDGNRACQTVTMAILHGYLQGPLRSLQFMEKMRVPVSGSR